MRIDTGVVARPAMRILIIVDEKQHRDFLKVTLEAESAAEEFEVPSVRCESIKGIGSYTEP